jgi:hypothetical protein
MESLLQSQAGLLIEIHNPCQPLGWILLSSAMLQIMPNQHSQTLVLSILISRVHSYVNQGQCRINVQM